MITNICMYVCIYKYIYIYIRYWFMIVCRIVLVFGWYYIGIYKVSALFVCNKRSGRRGIALIAFINILLVLFMIVCRIALVFG